MDILQVVQKLRPGTAWSCDIEDGQPVNLRQAEDGTDRVSIPTQNEIQTYIDTHPEPPSLQDQIATLQAQVAALLAAQNS